MAAFGLCNAITGVLEDAALTEAGHRKQRQDNRDKSNTAYHVWNLPEEGGGSKCHAVEGLDSE